MQLAYDFDLFNTMPLEIQAKYRRQLNDLGMSHMMSHQVALFRDQRTAAALKSADQTVRQLFLDAGFGLNVYSSGAPAGRYLARDDMGRLQRIGKLFELAVARRDDLKGADWGQFSYYDFLEYNKDAEPIDEIEVNALHKRALRRHRRRRTSATAGLLLGVGLVAYSVSGLIN